MKTADLKTRQNAQSQSAALLTSLSELQGYRLLAGEEKLGKISDYLIDETEWTIRIIVVDIGNWLTGRKVALDSSVFHVPGSERREVRVDLTREKIESGPTLDENETVSGQHRKALSIHYGWPMAWHAGTPGFGPTAAPVHPDTLSPFKESAAETHPEEPESETSLHSFREIEGYSIEATDGSIGHVEDFIADPVDWKLRYLVVDTRKWLPGKKVLVGLNWLRSISFPDRSARIDLQREQIRKGPLYDPDGSLDRAYEDRLHDYYNLPRYWI